MYRIVIISGYTPGVHSQESRLAVQVRKLCREKGELLEMQLPYICCSLSFADLDKLGNPNTIDEIDYILSRPIKLPEVRILSSMLT